MKGSIWIFYTSPGRWLYLYFLYFPPGGWFYSYFPHFPPGGMFTYSRILYTYFVWILLIFLMLSPWWMVLFIFSTLAPWWNVYLQKDSLYFSLWWILYILSCLATPLLSLLFQPGPCHQTFLPLYRAQLNMVQMAFSPSTLFTNSLQILNSASYLAI